MLAYFCKYVPEELMQAFDTELVCMEPHVTSFTQADALMQICVPSPKRFWKNLNAE